MRILSTGIACTAICCVLVPGAAVAAAKKVERSPLVAEVTGCRSIADAAARLSCFDRSVAALAAAETRQDVVVMDRQQVRDARKSLFGIGLPDLNLFAGSDDIDHIDATIADTQVDGSGHWTFRMADGARWVQTDDYPIARRPRANDKVVIRRAALGSFRLSVAGQPAVKAHRVN
jgi:hypothetical protein